MHLVGGAAVELAVARQRDRVGARLLERLADVVRLERGEHLDVARAPCGRSRRGCGRARPRSAAPAPARVVERGARRGDRGVDVGGAAARDARELAAVGRVLERERRAAAAARHSPPTSRRSVGERNRRRSRQAWHDSGPRRRLCAIIRTSPCARGATAISFFLFKRFASLLLTLLAASVVVFTVLDVLPGNAAEVMLGESATPESVAALSAKLGLDRPALVRYGDWMKGLATGELGTSIAYDTPIAQLVGERLVVTVPLALMAMALTTALAFALGLFAAARHGRAGDVGVMSVEPGRHRDARTSGSRSC